MMPVPTHRTKSFGDLGVAEVIADLARSNITVALPLSEHLPFDLIAVCPRGRLARVQVKARTPRGGRVDVELANTHLRRGSTMRTVYVDEVDGLAVFVPDHGVAYLSTIGLGTGSVTLRVAPTRNGQASGVRYVRDATDPMALFDGLRARRDSNPRPAT